LLIAAVFAVAAVYEQLKRRATGWTDGLPRRPRTATIGLWLAVGGGYAVRGVAGLGMVEDLGSRPILLLTAAAAMWAYGIAFVTSRWAVEALAFARPEEGRLVWSCGSAQRREHLLSLVRWLPKYDPMAAGPRAWRPLRAATPLGAPWNVAAIVSATCAGLAGVYLAGNLRAIPAMEMGVAFAVGALLVLRGRAQGRVIVLLGAAIVITGLELSIGTHRPVTALTPWFVAVGAQIWFFSQNLETMGRLPRGPFGRGRRA
jgi:hypothetical protein